MKYSQVIDNIKDVAKKVLPKGSALYLYGCRARGDYHKGSDWDLLLLLDKTSLTFRDYDISLPFRELGWSINEEINPQVYSKKEWQDNLFTPFYKNVERDKIVLI